MADQLLALIDQVMKEYKHITNKFELIALTKDGFKDG